MIAGVATGALAGLTIMFVMPPEAGLSRTIAATLSLASAIVTAAWWVHP